jgi:acyl-CoA synthetase (NDP forming)
VARDDGVDAVMAITVPTALGHLTPAILRTTIAKPIVVVTLDQQESVRLLQPTAKAKPGSRADRAGQPGETGDRCEAREVGEREAGATQDAIPSYLFPESAARALGHAVRYGAWRSSQEGQVPDLAGIRHGDARQLVGDFLARQHLGGWLPPDQVADLLACYGIDLVPAVGVMSAGEAARSAADPWC